MSDRIFGAFLTRATLADAERARDQVAVAAAAGLTHVFVETRSLPDWLPSVCRAHTVGLVASLPCFFEDDLPPDERTARVEPLDERGRPRAKLEWYTGTVPTDPAAVAALLPRVSGLLDHGPVDGVCLDFIRWPQHWELELRPGGPDLGMYSFDSGTLAAFSRATGRELPIADPAGAAQEILGVHRAEWLAFRTRTITQVAAQIARAIRATHPGVWVGAFLVPLTESERRDAVGQSATELSEHLDLLLPMAYHAMIRRGPDLAWELLDDTRAAAPGTPVVPLVQTTADAEMASGADWGETFGFAELTPTLDRLARAGDGFVLFPGEGLNGDGWRAVAQSIGRAGPPPGGDRAARRGQPRLGIPGNS